MKYLGDVHLGKKFEANVPLHRRGDREKMQWAQFLQELEGEGPLVQVGDLFDKPVVSNAVVFETARALKAAQQKRPIALLRGNHDASRDSSRVSSFQILTELVRPYGVIVADEEPVAFHGVTLIPWSPWKTAEEMVTEYPHRFEKTVAGHWDVVMGGSNQIPSAELKTLGVETAITGHDHNARTLEMDGLEVIVTGSMQPYSHSEDATGQLYITLTLDQIDQDLRDKCVRLVLAPGEELLEPIDCLQLQVTRATQEEVELDQVEFDAFDLRNLFDQACEKTGLGDLKETVFKKLEEERGSS
ncbi:MAG: exonuclease SbcCD subunit D [Brevundimonas sp.]